MAGLVSFPNDFSTSDRIVENALWVTFAVLGPIPLWVPLLVLTRGFIVDGLRSMSYADGMTAFGERNMMRSPITRWLTAGRFMRALFGYAKAGGFVFLTGYWGSLQSDAAGTWVETLHDFVPYLVIGWGAVWLSVALTIVRGVPVIFDAWEMIMASSRKVARQTPVLLGGPVRGLTDLHVDELFVGGKKCRELPVNQACDLRAVVL